MMTSIVVQVNYIYVIGLKIRTLYVVDKMRAADLYGDLRARGFTTVYI